MWPHKSGLGIRLSYGVDGNGIVTLDKDNVEGTLSAKVDFPRHRQDGPLLKEIEGSDLVILNSQRSSYNLNSKLFDGLEETLLKASSKSTNNFSSMFVPNDILNSYMIESRALTSNLAYDSTFGSIFTMFDLRTRSAAASERAVAYVSGELGKVLNISILRPQENDILRRTHEKVNSEVISSSIMLPAFGKPYQVALSESIKQIEVSPILFDFVPSTMLVRTNEKVYLLRCYRSAEASFSPQKSNLELDVIGEIPSKDLKGYDFAYVSFNPHDFTLFSIVDVRGNFGVWRAPQKGASKLKVFKEKIPEGSCNLSVYEASELSNWKKITWSYEAQSLLVITRSSITQFKLGEKWSKQKMVTSNTWSRISDFARVKDNAFLLTSKELIWINMKGSLERLISWKHFLDDSDPSLKLNVIETSDDLTLCLIYSQIHPLIFVYTFGWKDDRPFSLRDPYYIRRKSNSELQQISMIELVQRTYHTASKGDLEVVEEENSFETRKFGLFELSTTLSLTMSSFADQPDIYFAPAPKDGTKNRVGPETYGKASKALRLSQKQVDVLSRFYEPDAFSTNENQIEAIQKYAFSLGQGAFKLNLAEELQDLLPSYMSLLDISDAIPHSVTDVSEIDLMLEQLTGFYKQKDIQLSSLIQSGFLKHFRFKETNSHNSEKSIEDLHIAFKSHFHSTAQMCKLNEFFYLQKTTVQIAASLIKARNDGLKQKLRQNLIQTIDDSSSSVQSLFNHWDENFEIPEVEHRNSQYSTPDVFHSLPTIKLSQRKGNASSSQMKHNVISQNSKGRPHNKSVPSQTGEVDSREPDQSSSVQASQVNQTIHSSQINLSSAKFGSQKRFASSQSAGRSKTKKKKKSGFA